MTVEFTEYKPQLTKAESPRDAYIAMWSDTLGTYTPESYKGILGRYRYEPRKQEAPTMLYTQDGETVKNRSTGENVGTLTQRKIGKFYHWHFQGVEVDGQAPVAAPLQIMWAIRGTEQDALTFARERYNANTYQHRLDLYRGSYAMRKLVALQEGKRRTDTGIMLAANIINSLAYRVFIFRQYKTEEEMRKYADSVVENALRVVREAILYYGAEAQHLVEEFPSKDSKKYTESAAPGLNYSGDLYVTVKEKAPTIAMYLDFSGDLDAKTIVNNAIKKALDQTKKYTEQYKEDLYYAMTLTPTIQ